jgi:predicted GTPase
VPDSQRSEILGHEKGDNETTKTYSTEDIGRMYNNLKKLSYSAVARISAWNPSGQRSVRKSKVSIISEAASKIDTSSVESVFGRSLKRTRE